MAGKLSALNTDDYVSEQAAVTKLIEHLQDALGVGCARAEVKDILTG